MTAPGVENCPQSASPVPEFSAAEVEQFRRDGYVVARGPADKSLRDRMLAVTLRDLARRVEPLEYEAELHYPGAPASRQAEGGDAVRRLKQAHARGSVFTEWVTQPALVRRLQQLLGPKIVMPLAHHNCVMTKQPRYSSQTGWHQDIRYWRFARPELVSVWLALGREFRTNGGLFVVPGSHRLDLARDRFDDELFFRIDLPENAAVLSSATAVELEPGDVLFFHCLTLHSAGRNDTDETKYSAVFTFRPADNPPIAGTRSAAAELPIA